MTKLPSIKDLPVANKKVLLRTDYDVPLRFAQGKLLVTDTIRIEESLPTLNYLLKQKAKVMIISHLGRPGGRRVARLSLKPVAELLSSKLKTQKSKLQLKTQNFQAFDLGKNIILLENLRFNPGEEKNSRSFAQELANLADFYVNDAFAVSHRNHASIVATLQFFPTEQRAFGFDFLEEIKVLDRVRNNSRRPIVVILGGAKKDKLGVLERLGEWADWILVGGKLPTLIHDLRFKIYDDKKLMVAELNPEGKDMTLESIEEFKKIINQAKTIVWAGPMGQYEDEKWARGTKEIAQAVVKSKAYTVVGGGDTETALTKLGLIHKVGYLSSGGGAMLAFLAKGTLPGIEAITKNYD